MFNMGQTSSAEPRASTLYESVSINLTDDVIRRLSSEPNPPMNDPKTKPEPQLKTPGEEGADKHPVADQEDELTRNKNYWKKRLEDLQHVNEQTKQVLEAERERGFKDVQGTVSSASSEKEEAPCGDNFKEVCSCYKDKKETPLDCGKSVKDFVVCVTNKRFEKFSQKKEKEKGVENEIKGEDPAKSKAGTKKNQEKEKGVENEIKDPEKSKTDTNKNQEKDKGVKNEIKNKNPAESKTDTNKNQEKDKDVKNEIKDKDPAKPKVDTNQNQEKDKGVTNEIKDPAKSKADPDKNQENDKGVKNENKDPAKSKDNSIQIQEKDKGVEKEIKVKDQDPAKSNDKTNQNKDDPLTNKKG